MRLKSSKSAAVKHFRTNLRAAMDSRGLSHRAMGHLADVPYSYLSKILMGHVEPSLERAEHLAKTLGFSLAEMLVNPRKFSRNGD